MAQEFDIGKALNMGDRGPLVAELQGMLSKVGFPVAQDGIFGENTWKAVVAYQTSKGILVDGVVGRQTMHELYKDTGMTTDQSVKEPGNLDLFPDLEIAVAKAKKAPAWLWPLIGLAGVYLWSTSRRGR